MRLNNLSYLVKVPLALCLVSIGSAIGVFIATYYLLVSYVQSESLTRVQQIAGTIAASAKGAIARDEIWDVYKQILAASEVDTGTEIIVLNNQKQILVASDPMKFPVMSSLSILPSSLRKLVLNTDQKERSSGLFSVSNERSNDVYGSAAAVYSEDSGRLGTVLVLSRQDATLPKVRDLLWRMLILTAIAMAVIVPLGWQLGRKIVSPLNRLRMGMANIGERQAALIDPHADIGSDEIGQLHREFVTMFHELENKEQLEQQIQSAERMALAGKLASSVAHEINNPLGGMLNAVSNLRMHGYDDPFVEKTISLIERGLRQIQDSMSALMAQARREHTPLTLKDFNDLQLLTEPQARARNISVYWTITCPENELGIRAVPIRQIVLNLVLNAIKAAERQVTVLIVSDRASLHIHVTNDGQSISSQREFAVPTQDAYGRTGLGLWVCFQLTKQLNGSLEIAPIPGDGGTLAIFEAPLENLYA
ncbi:MULTISPECIES: sensor histidine kinase [Herbaspirillum]|uniref:sensor histidine kinase n=1 Tax=Herbaspirillum TaxID=963 RepID=UPI00067B1D02|nr:MULTISPECIES: HAMP domain-containing sensor histidine kinase [Herbaspirillum]